MKIKDSVIVLLITAEISILGYAGIYTGKNLDTLKKTGWRIFVLALFVMVGTFLASAVISHLVLKMLGQI